jgi:hypothetical protein
MRSVVGRSVDRHRRSTLYSLPDKLNFPLVNQLGPLEIEATKVCVFLCHDIGTFLRSDKNRVLFGGWPARGNLVAHALSLALCLHHAYRNQQLAHCFSRVKSSMAESVNLLAGHFDYT